MLVAAEVVKITPFCGHVCVPRTENSQPQWLASSLTLSQLIKAWRVLGFLGAWPCLSHPKPSLASGSHLSLLSCLSPGSQPLELAWKCLLGGLGRAEISLGLSAGVCFWNCLQGPSHVVGALPLKAWAGLILFLVWGDSVHTVKSTLQMPIHYFQKPTRAELAETNSFLRGSKAPANGQLSLADSFLHLLHGAALTTAL